MLSSSACAFLECPTHLYNNIIPNPVQVDSMEALAEDGKKLVDDYYQRKKAMQ